MLFAVSCRPVLAVVARRSPAGRGPWCQLSVAALRREGSDATARSTASLRPFKANEPLHSLPLPHRPRGQPIKPCLWGGAGYGSSETKRHTAVGCLGAITNRLFECRFFSGPWGRGPLRVGRGRQLPYPGPPHPANALSRNLNRVFKSSHLYPLLFRPGCMCHLHLPP